MIKNLNIKMEETFLAEYKNYCDKNGFSISKKIRIHMQNDLLKWKNKK